MKYSDINNNLNTINKDIYLDKDISAIKNAIKNILLTRKGEVPGNPNFGSDLESVLFEIMDDITYDYAEDIIREALDEFEPRIYIKDISFAKDFDNNVLLIKIAFSLKENLNQDYLTVVEYNINNNFK